MLHVILSFGVGLNLVSVITFIWYIAGRLARMETRLNGLPERVRMLELGAARHHGRRDDDNGET